MVAMYPYKVIAKKQSRLSIGSIGDQHHVIIPVSIKEEYNPQTQLSLAVEVLMGHSHKLLEKLHQDLDDTSSKASYLDSGKLSRFPSLPRLFHQLNLNSQFFQEFSIKAVDEHEELMGYLDRCLGMGPVQPTFHQDHHPTGLDGAVACCSSSEQESFLSKIHSQEEESYQEEEMDAKTIVRMNWDFLNCLDEPDEDGSCYEEDDCYINMGAWVGHEPRTTNNTAASSLNTAEIPGTSGFESSDLLYYECHMVRHPSVEEGPEVEEDKHEEEDTSTKSDAPADETFRQMEIDQNSDSASMQIQSLTKNQRKKLARQARKSSAQIMTKDVPRSVPQEHAEDSLDRSRSLKTKLTSVAESEDQLERSSITHEVSLSERTIEQPMPPITRPAQPGASSPTEKETAPSSVAKGRKKKKKGADVLEPPPPPTRDRKAQEASTVVQQRLEPPTSAPRVAKAPVPNDDDSEDSDDRDAGSGNNKDSDILKKAFKDLLASQIAKINEEIDLDQYEKQSLVEINDFVGVSKKMKQKAKKNLRINIENYKKELDNQRDKLQMEYLESAEFQLEELKQYTGFPEIDVNDPKVLEVLLRCSAQFLPKRDLASTFGKLQKGRQAYLNNRNSVWNGIQGTFKTEWWETSGQEDSTSDQMEEWLAGIYQ